jgi:hypothetical protein
MKEWCGVVCSWWRKRCLWERERESSERKRRGKDYIPRVIFFELEAKERGPVSKDASRSSNCCFDNPSLPVPTMSDGVKSNSSGKDSLELTNFYDVEMVSLKPLSIQLGLPI